MFGPIRAVAVDDEPSHLLAITTGLSNAGIPCVGYWFDREQVQLQPPPPDGGLPHLRIVVTDLNLNELGGTPETAALWAVIAGVLKMLVSPSGGPYLLAFWTRMGIEAEQVKQMLYDRAADLEVPPPAHVVSLPKAPILAANPKGEGTFGEQMREFYDALVAASAELKKLVSDAVQAEPSLNAVAAWEARSAEAAASAVSQVYRCASADVGDPKLTTASMAKVLGRIATAAAGDSMAAAEPARALDAGMLDILIDQFGSSVDSQPFKDTVASVIGPIVRDKIEFRDNVSTHANLNTFFQVDQVVGSVRSWDRGVVLDAKRPHYTANNLGFNATNLVEPEFLFPAELLFPVDKFPDERRVDAREHLRAVRHSADVVLVELGADCDHAQDQKRTRRFLVGLEISQQHFYLTQGPEGKLRNGALEMLGPWMIGGAVKYLLVSCRRYWTWQGDAPPPGDAKYRLRATVVNKLLHRYASWNSRPGIVEFR